MLLRSIAVFLANSEKSHTPMSFALPSYVSSTGHARSGIPNEPETNKSVIMDIT